MIAATLFASFAIACVQPTVHKLPFIPDAFLPTDMTGVVIDLSRPVPDLTRVDLFTQPPDDGFDVPDSLVAGPDGIGGIIDGGTDDQ